jgi:hypothetical protein
MAYDAIDQFIASRAIAPLLDAILWDWGTSSRTPDGDNFDTPQANS